MPDERRDDAEPLVEEEHGDAVPGETLSDYTVRTQEEQETTPEAVAQREAEQEAERAAAAEQKREEEEAERKREQAAERKREQEEAAKKARRRVTQAVRLANKQKREEKKATAAAEEAEVAAEFRALELRTAKRGVDLVEDYLWVYKNLGTEKVKMKSAPTTGALELLAWVQKDIANKKHFYGPMLTKAQAVQEAREKQQLERELREEARKEAERREKEAREEAEKREEAEEDKPLVEVERLLREFAGEDSEKP